MADFSQDSIIDESFLLDLNSRMECKYSSIIHAFLEFLLKQNKKSVESFYQLRTEHGDKLEKKEEGNHR